MTVGRPYKGLRDQLNVRIPHQLMKDVRAAKGNTPLNDWVEAALRLALRPVASAIDPTLRPEDIDLTVKPVFIPPAHEHSPKLLVRTELSAAGKRRIYACECGQEVSA